MIYALDTTVLPKVQKPYRNANEQIRGTAEHHVVENKLI